MADSSTDSGRSDVHPIVAQMKPSAEQLPAVTAGGRDIVLTAGAGTGKTRTLVARALSLLAAGVSVRELAAITFTVKAAREMRNRLRREVQHYLAAGDLAPAERRHWEDVYSALDATRIGTIHSLCSEILRNHPAEAGVDPRFGVLDEAQAQVLAQEACAEAVGWAANDPEAVAVFTLLDPAALTRVLDQLLGDRLKAAELFRSEPWRQWDRQVIAALRGRFLDNPAVVAVMDELAALGARGVVAAAANQGDLLAANVLELLRCWDAVQEAQQQQDVPTLVRLLSGLPGLLRSNIGQAASWRPEDPPKAQVKILRALYDSEVKPLVEDVDPTLDDALALLLPQLGRIFAKAVERYRAAKTLRAVLDFDDLEQGALQLLQDHPDVTQRWQAEIGAILVDEFQDTNGRQRDLVRTINGGRRRLFIVGDAKQSIYRFRGAEVQVFRLERERIRAAGGETLELTVSYRAHARLLEVINPLLLAVLGGAADPARPWREPFAPLQPHAAAGQPILHAPFVELQLAAGAKNAGGLELAAAAVVQRLVQIVAEAGDPARLNYGHIAILCRSYRGFADYEDALEAAGVPYVTVAGSGFYNRPEVRDLFNALQALTDPTDDLALAGLLRSPAVGFSDAELFDLRLDGAGRPRPLWTALQASEEPRSVWAAGLIGSLHLQVGRTTVADLLKQLLDRTDYVGKLLLAGQRRAARNVGKLLDDALRAGLVSVGEFLEYARNLRDVGAREGDARADEEGVVQIMTVHQAKGLEFPVVVIGDAGSAGGRTQPGLLLDDEWGVTLAAANADGARPLVYRLAQARQADMEDAESSRLLYVAATRAAEKLIVSGNVTVDKRGQLSAKGWLDQLLTALGEPAAPPDFDPAGSRVHGWSLALDGQPVALSLYEPGWQPSAPSAAPAAGDTLRRLDWSPALVQPVTIDATAGPAPDAAPDRVWRVAPAAGRVHAPAWLVGKLVHEAIAAWRFPVSAELEPWIAARARSGGLADAGRIRDAQLQTLRMLQRLEESPFFAFLARADQRLHEVPFSAADAGHAADGRIDLVCRHGARWTVVDFKTDQIGAWRSLAAVLDRMQYVAQVQRYTAAAAAWLGQDPAAYLCFLDDERRVTVLRVQPDGLLERWRPEAATSITPG